MNLREELLEFHEHPKPARSPTPHLSLFWFWEVEPFRYPGDDHTLPSVSFDRLSIRMRRIMSEAEELHNEIINDIGTIFELAADNRAPTGYTHTDLYYDSQMHPWFGYDDLYDAWSSLPKVERLRLAWVGLVYEIHTFREEGEDKFDILIDNYLYWVHHPNNHAFYLLPPVLPSLYYDVMAMMMFRKRNILHQRFISDSINSNGQLYSFHRTSYTIENTRPPVSQQTAHECARIGLWYFLSYNLAESLNVLIHGGFGEYRISSVDVVIDDNVMEKHGKNSWVKDHEFWRSLMLSSVVSTIIHEHTPLHSPTALLVTLVWNVREKKILCSWVDMRKSVDDYDGSYSMEMYDGKIRSRIDTLMFDDKTLIDKFNEEIKEL